MNEVPAPGDVRRRGLGQVTTAVRARPGASATGRVSHLTRRTMAAAHFYGPGGPPKRLPKGSLGRLSVYPLTYPPDPPCCAGNSGNSTYRTFLHSCPLLSPLEPIRLGPHTSSSVSMPAPHPAMCGCFLPDAHMVGCLPHLSSTRATGGPRRRT